jgi:hypothetical protein
VLHLADKHSDAVPQPKEEAKANGRPSDDFHAAGMGDDEILEHEASEDDWQGPDQDHRQQAQGGVGEALGQARHALENAEKIAPGVQADGQKRPHMHRDIQVQARGLAFHGRQPQPIEGRPGQDQMPRGADRQKLRDALNNGQDDQLQQVHARVLVSGNSA